MDRFGVRTFVAFVLFRLIDIDIDFVNQLACELELFCTLIFQKRSKRQQPILATHSSVVCVLADSGWQ